MPGTIDNIYGEPGFHEGRGPSWSSVRCDKPVCTLTTSTMDKDKRVRLSDARRRFPVHKHRTGLDGAFVRFDAIAWYPQITTPHTHHSGVGFVRWAIVQLAIRHVPDLNTYSHNNQ